MTISVTDQKSDPAAVHDNIDSDGFGQTIAQLPRLPLGPLTVPEPTRPVDPIGCARATGEAVLGGVLTWSAAETGRQVAPRVQMGAPVDAGYAAGGAVNGVAGPTLVIQGVRDAAKSCRQVPVFTSPPPKKP